MYNSSALSRSKRNLCCFVICKDSLSQECAVGMKCTSCMKPVEKPTLETFGVSAEEAVREMRFRIYQDTCLTASAGNLSVSVFYNIFKKYVLGVIV